MAFDRKAFGQRVRNLRLQVGAGQKHFSKIVNIQNWSRIESGSRLLSLVSCERLCQHTGVSLRELFGGTQGIIVQEDDFMTEVSLLLPKLSIYNRNVLMDVMRDLARNKHPRKYGKNPL